MPTPFLACPTAVVEAPIEVVWNLVTHFEGWGDFYDCRVISVEPPGAAVVGQRMIGEAGPRFLHLKAVLEFKRIDESKHEVEIDGQLPLGLMVHEDMDMIPLGPERCRVNYHCNFTIPDGWRGWFFRWIIGKEMTRSPQDPIERLKRAAEAKAKERAGGTRERVSG
jgi:hypothetical protein